MTSHVSFHVVPYWLMGHVVHNWKVRWFVLLQDKLLYYKFEGGKKESSPKGRILLDGCTITCPCLEYENRPLLIKLRTKTNTDYFLECCSREERDSWALDITGAIHAGHPVQVQELHRMKNSFKLLENISLHHIVDKMRDSSTGIKLTRNLEQGNRYKETFTGSALVDWLISNNFAVSRFEAVTLASMLMEENFTKPVGTRSIEAMRYSDLSEQFLDDSTALYMFAESSKKMLSSKEELQFNISELSGMIVKQGFLVKQGHKRKNWKVRKFVLRAEPAFLHYYDPTKVCECGVGTLRNPLPDLNIIMKRQHSHAINVSLSQISWIPLLMSWEIRPLWPYSRRLSLYDFLSLCSLPIISSLRFPFLSCGAAV
uniref:Pleckstrin 2 n=1 Tax=Anas platyrhynchos platyrhynchos TaxID=8840 RepID=U3J560_ANAPP